MPMKPGTCKLCLTTTDLCNSHIIPEWCYEGTYGDKHRAKLMQAAPNKDRWVQKGLRQHLLCRACETLLSKTEKWFKEFWFGPNGLPQHVDDDFPEIVIPDMQQFHLFHLAVLWRASVADGDEWNTVSLGPYEEKIRQILLHPTRWSEGMYPVFVQAVVDENKDVVYGVVGKPQRSRYDQSWVYYTVYTGAEFAVFMTESPSSVQKKFLDETYMGGGRIRLLRADFRQSGTFRIFGTQRRKG